MIEVETEGFEEAREKLRWILEHSSDVSRWIAGRMAEIYRQELDVPDDYLHMIEVVDGGDRVYGVSVEPDPEMVRREELEGVVLLLAPSDPGDDRWTDIVGANPWVPDLVPVAPDAEDAVWISRDANDDERAAVRNRNRETMEDRNLRPVPANARLAVQVDVAYNAARAEFGFGDALAGPTWRPALRALIEDRLGDILDDVTRAFVDSELDEKALPEFERRSADWWEQNAGFMDFVWG